MICDENGIILEVDSSMAFDLMYTKDELVGKFVGIIMSKFMSNMHQHCLLKEYHSLPPSDKEHCNKLLSGKMSKRPLIIYTKSKQPIYVNLSVVKENNQTFSIDYIITKNNNNNILYTSSVGPPNTNEFVESKIDMMVISIELKNVNDTNESIKVYSFFQENLMEIIKLEYYPYLYIYEIMDKRFVLIMNLEWSYHLTSVCASTVYSFLQKLYKRVNEIVDFSTGVAYGKLHYGYLDNHLRFFGKTIDRSARYESVSDTNSFCTDKAFYKKLVTETQKSVNYHTGFYSKDIIHISLGGGEGSQQ